jgi:hypothetical protein
MVSNMATVRRKSRKRAESQERSPQFEPVVRENKSGERQISKIPQSDKSKYWQFFRTMISCLAVIASIITPYLIYRQITEARAATELDQRATVGFFDEVITPVTNEKEKFFTLVLTVKNTGKTPAQGVSVEAITAPRLRDAPPTWQEVENSFRASFETEGMRTNEYLGSKVGALYSTNKVQSNILAPGATQTWNYQVFRRKLDEKPDRLRHWFLVRIIYTDVFSNRKHTTEMCFMEVLGSRVEHCSVGNSMD